jgi:hypothetical protein
MTSDTPWDPSDHSLSSDEASIRAALESGTPYVRGRSIDAIHSINQTRSSAAIDVTSLAPMLESITISSTQSRRRKGAVTAEELAKRWHIGLETARKTIEKTTQRAVRNFTETVGSRRLKPYAYQLRYPRINVEMYCDLIIGHVKSLNGNQYAMIYCTPFHWMCVDPVKEKSDAHYTLDNLFRRVGFPRVLIPDNAKELTEGDFKRKALKAQVPIKPVEAYTKNANIAEDGVRELKRAYRRTMSATNTPECLWDDCLVYVALIRSHTALNIRQLGGDVPATLMAGDTSDISFICEFGWYDFVWYLSPEDEAMERKRLGRYCGPSFDIGDALCAKILTEKGRQVSRTSVFPLSDEENNSDAIKEKKRIYTEELKKNLGSKYTFIEGTPDDGDEETPTPELYEPLEAEEAGEAGSPDILEADDIQHEAFDKYIASRVCVPRGDEMSYGTVKARKRDAEGNLIGRSNDNPLFDSSVYEVEFESGETEAYTANIIAESIYSQIDEEGYTHYTLNDIIDHKSDGNALSKDDGFDAKGRKRHTTKGWWLCCQWQDGSTTWESLKDMKDSDPLRVADYAVNNKLVEEPAFAWWVPYTIRKRKRILSAVKKRYFKQQQKYGIELPKTVKRALEIDKETGTTYWRDAIRKEMKAVQKAFEILEDDAPNPVGHTLIDCHMVFDIKADFTRKARYVAGGHQTEPPASITYASVVSRESVRIAFMLAALNGVEVKVADLSNAYLNAPVREKIYTICGPEFGPLEGKRARIVRALYGLKSAGFSWRSLLAQVLHDDLKFTPCKADNDVWIKAAQKADGTRYYEMVLVYTDDVLVISTNPDAILCKIDQHFKLKEGSIGKPTRYLGSTISEHTFPDDPNNPCWAQSSEDYVKEAIRNVKTWLDKRGLKLKSKVSSMLPSGYTPELDVSELCNDEDTNYYQQQIGVLRWAVELGRIDICTEVSMMAAFCAAPRRGHLDAVFHLFAYLNTHQRSKLVFDPSYVPIVEPEQPDWGDFYRGAEDVLPPDMPEALGKSVQIICFVDSDHAGDKVTRRSRTGVLIFVNRAPIIFYSKKQTSIETSSFGSEFSAMKTAVELVEGLRYKLRMMGVPLEGPAFVRADNMSVVNNTSRPESQLKKKSNSIAYHYVREKVAAGVILVSHEDTKSNLADMLTKTQSVQTRLGLACHVLH